MASWGKLSKKVISKFSRAQSSSFLENQGPETVEELARWDERLVSKLQLVGLASQAMDAMSSGMLLSTDYSGFDFPKEAIRVAVAALEKAEGKCNPEINFARACDWG